MAKKGSRAVKKSGAKKSTKATRKTDLDSIEDPELRKWMAEVQQRQKDLSDPKKKPVVASRIEDAGQSRLVFRRKADPIEIKSLLRVARRKSAVPRMSEDIKLIRESWERVVGPSIAAESRVYSFAKGVLTIEILSASLLQEIRQFQKHVIFSDLLDAWQISQPVVTVKYRLGKK